MQIVTNVYSKVFYKIFRYLGLIMILLYGKMMSFKKWFLLIT